MGKNSEFKENTEIINNLNLESKLDQVNIIDQLPISSTVKIANPGEEIKITIDNITNVGETKKEILPEVVEQLHKVEQVVEDVVINNVSKEKDSDSSHKNTIKNLKDEFLKSEPVKNLEHMVDELRKDFSNISIVDVSKKKLEQLNNMENPVKAALEKAFAMSPLSSISKDEIQDKAFDSLIMIGSSVIAVASIASNLVADVGSKLINKN